MSPHESLPRGVWLLGALLWGVYLAGMYGLGELELFQASPYYYFTAAAGVVLVLLAVKGALWPARAVCLCGHAHRPGEPCGAHPHGDVAHADHEPSGGEHGRAGGAEPLVAGALLVVVLLAPVLAGILVPHRAMLSLAAARRMTGTGLDSSDILDALKRERRDWRLGARDYQEATPLDVLEIGRDSPGLKVRTVGFVMGRSEQLPNDVGRIARFRMTCCAADALPIAVLVRGGKIAETRRDTWIEVRGVVEQQSIGGRPATVIVVDPSARPGDGLREVPAPDDPYI